MKLSTESIVAAAVAIVFSVFVLGAIAREQGVRGSSSTTMPLFNQVAALGSPSSRALSGTEEGQLLFQ
jgi:hypothetical protein